MPRNPNKTPCFHPGCKAWAIRGQPTCSAHRPGGVPFAGAPARNVNAQTHGLYASTIRLDEIALPLALAETVTDEILAIRTHLRHLDQMLSEAVTSDDFLRFFQAFLTASRTIARLLRDRQALTPDKAEDLMKATLEALSILESQTEVKLVP